MWLKVIGSILIITSGTCIGFKLAWRSSERPKQITQLINCLVSLKSYINYVAAPLPEALEKCAAGMEGSVADLFRDIATLLRQKGWLSPLEVMQQKLKENQNRLCLNKPEIEILFNLAANLGTTDRQEQFQYLSLAQEELRKIEREALSFKEQNVKMYRYLGICSGLALVIILI
ncbi:spore iii ab: stage iii sporulation protein ab [Lucifera butyrica]|uniref:Spore iii ab: stage iii sporulation protein ab n=1 Tax=Lucifera butyrica TaxID=1351585 RepID=A0A498R9G2_9FIRM|nr:stage III sporulation protein SpoIIIAB [Lucifera butyrica]VBB08021.1 spore iii ab: stage iii sporulation protein ab [Lucifera butyrica]